MIKGVLTFKPLATGDVQILIKGTAKDIPELAKLYGVEVEITRSVERSIVQSPVEIVLKNYITGVEALTEAAKIDLSAAGQQAKAAPAPIEPLEAVNG